MNSPIVWYGGKGNIASKIAPFIPQHTTYVETHGGGGSLLFYKEPSPVEVYNDVNSGLVGFFRTLRDPEKFERFHELVSLTPWSREEFTHCRATWESCTDDVDRAFRWFVTARQSFSGAFGRSWSSAVGVSRRGMAMTVSRWLTTIEALPETAARLLTVQIEQQDFRTILDRYDREDTCFYLDPPYVPKSRRSPDVYQHEMTVADHEDLVARLLRIKGKVVLSGYPNEVYLPLEEQDGWKRHDFEVSCFAAPKTIGAKLTGSGATTTNNQRRIEAVWVKA